MKLKICILSITLIFYSATISFAGAFASDLAARYKLNDAAGNGTWVDISGQGMDLTGGNTPGAVSGHSGGVTDALDISSGTNQHVQRPHTGSNALDITTTAFSISAWVNASAWGTGTRTIVYKFSGSAGYMLRVENRRPTCWADGNQALSTAANLSDGVWYNLICTYDGTTLTVWQDNVSVDTAAKVDAVNTNTRAFAIGVASNDFATNACTTCLVDDVAIWTKSLSSVERAELLSLGTDFINASTASIRSLNADAIKTITSLNAATLLGAGSALDLGEIISSFTYDTVTTGAPTGVQVDLEGSIDCSTWEILDTSVSTVGEMRHTVNKAVRCIRLNLIELSGGTAPTLTGIIISGRL